VEAIRSFTEVEILPIAADVDRQNQFPNVCFLLFIQKFKQKLYIYIVALVEEIWRAWRPWHDDSR
jgi:hypothetical protein